MAGAKMDFKRILAVSGIGTAMAGMLALGGVAQKKADKELLHYVAGLTPTTYVCDTINVSKPEDIDQIVYGVFFAGNYDRMNNKVHTYHYRDLTGSDVGRTVTGVVNQTQVLASYHELRHAYNSRLMWRFDGFMGPDVFVIDEVSARVAEELAKISDKTPLKPGEMSVAVSYNIKQNYDLQKVANEFINKALVEMNQAFEVSANVFEEASYYSQYDPILSDVKINKKTLMNEMMVFEINGKKQNMLKLASKDMQNKVEKFKIKVENYLNTKGR